MRKTFIILFIIPCQILSQKTGMSMIHKCIRLKTNGIADTEVETCIPVDDDHNVDYNFGNSKLKVGLKFK